MAERKKTKIISDTNTLVRLAGQVAKNSEQLAALHHVISDVSTKLDVLLGSGGNVRASKPNVTTKRKTHINIMQFFTKVYVSQPDLFDELFVDVDKKEILNRNDIKAVWSKKNSRDEKEKAKAQQLYKLFTKAQKEKLRSIMNDVNAASDKKAVTRLKKDTGSDESDNDNEDDNKDDDENENDSEEQKELSDDETQKTPPAQPVRRVRNSRKPKIRQIRKVRKVRN